MNMETTIASTPSLILPGQGHPVYLGGPSVNPFWNVPLALKSLCGEIEAAQNLTRLMRPLWLVASLVKKKRLPN